MSIKETLFVIGVVFKNTFLLRNFYELIPITYHTNLVYNKASKIPYMGIEGSFVSIIPKLGTKGIIEPPIRGFRNTSAEGSASSSFGNSVAIDFQILGKNFHIKVTSSKTGDCKFHITGITNSLQIQNVVNCFIEQLKCVEKIWIPFFRISYEQKINFMKEIYDVLVIGQKLRHYEDPHVLNWIESLTDTREELKACAKLIVRYVIEDMSPERYADRLLRICSLQTGQYSIFHKNEDFNFVRYDIYNGSYAGNIGYSDLYFIHIVRKLAEQGYHVGFSNFCREEIRIRIEIQYNHNGNDGNKTEDRKEHLFVIKSSGSVTLSSKGMPSEALSMGEHVIKTIRTIVESMEYVAEKNGKYYDSMTNTKNFVDISNILPQTQKDSGSLIPTTQSSSTLFDSLMDSYYNEFTGL